jgi:hypothetical protein
MLTVSAAPAYSAQQRRETMRVDYEYQVVLCDGRVQILRDGKPINEEDIPAESRLDIIYALIDKVEDLDEEWEDRYREAVYDN